MLWWPWHEALRQNDQRLVRPGESEKETLHVPRHVIPWERGGFSDRLFRGDWHVGHSVMCQ
jgi:hypothetical protein